MTRSEFTANRLREVFLNGTWIANTNYKSLLESITWKQALHKTGNLNTIAALTWHINYYLSGMLHVFAGGKLEIRDKYSFDMPPLESEDAWKKRVQEFVENAEKFALYVEKMPDPQWDAVFVDEKYGTYQRNIEGVIEHGYYHLGQISLIKKLSSASST